MVVDSQVSVLRSWCMADVVEIVALGDRLLSVAGSSVIFVAQAESTTLGLCEKRKCAVIIMPWHW